VHSALDLPSVRPAACGVCQIRLERSGLIVIKASREHARHIKRQVLVREASCRRDRVLQLEHGEHINAGHGGDRQCLGMDDP
jgi:hypothetical protein